MVNAIRRLCNTDAANENFRSDCLSFRNPVFRFLEPFMKIDIHVCLVSQQATPNLAPILAAEFRPRNVILLVSRQMQQQADALEHVLKKYGVGCIRVAIDDPYDIANMTEQFLNLAGQYEAESIGLNVTGGTKPMAIAAQEAFRMAGKPVFYVNPETNAIQFLSADIAPLRLPSKIKIDDYLSAHGYGMVSGLQRQAVGSAALTRLTETLVLNVKSFGRAIGTMNFLASQAEKKGERRGREVQRHCVDIEVEAGTLQDQDWLKLADMFADAGVFKLIGNKLRFTNADTRFYANGGWLEDHVFGIARSLNLQDAALNMRVKNSFGAGHAENEIDVALLSRNRLHLIECKTRNFLREGTHGAEALYKLDSLAALGGLNTRCMLVSYRELGPQDKQRAKDLNVKTVEAHQLHDLKNQLQSWIAS
jgi:hypothetical protein